MANFKIKLNLVAQAKKSGCLRCKELNPRVLEFHHRDPATKAAAISALMRSKISSISELETELSKCDVLCANCHRLVEQEKVAAAQELRRRSRSQTPARIRAARRRALRAKISLAFQINQFDDQELRAMLVVHLRENSEHNGDCWQWQGTFGNKGMLVTGIAGRLFSAKKLAVIVRDGFFPKGHVLQTCNNEACVNPEHVLAKKTLVVDDWEHISLSDFERAANTLLEDQITLERTIIRFGKYVDILESGHWLWKGGNIRNFPHFTLLGRPILAKRVSLALRLRRLPRKIRNTCEFKNCINPEHLDERF